MKTGKKNIVIIAIIVSVLAAGIYVVYSHIAPDWIDMSEPGPPIEELIDSIRNEGDIESYDKLAKYYPAEVLPYAFYMANEYNYGKACYDVFSSMSTIYPMEKKANDEMCKIAMLYLKKGAELGDISCINSMCTELTLGRYVPRDSALAFHYAYLFHRDSIVAEHVVSTGILLGRR